MNPARRSSLKLLPCSLTDRVSRAYILRLPTYILWRRQLQKCRSKPNKTVEIRTSDHSIAIRTPSRRITVVPFFFSSAPPIILLLFSSKIDRNYYYITFIWTPPIPDSGAYLYQRNRITHATQRPAGVIYSCHCNLPYKPCCCCCTVLSGSSNKNNNNIDLYSHAITIAPSSGLAALFGKYFRRTIDRTAIIIFKNACSSLLIIFYNRSYAYYIIMSFTYNNNTLYLFVTHTQCFDLNISPPSHYIFPPHSVRAERTSQGHARCFIGNGRRKIRGVRNLFIYSSAAAPGTARRLRAESSRFFFR